MGFDDGTNAYLHADGVLAFVPVTGTPQYMLDDALGSVRGLSDSTGMLSGTADYDVFGAVRQSGGSASIFGFTGEQRDATTGFTYLRARYLDPTLGRFTQADSVQPNAPGTGGWNLYAYVANNPVTWTDPSGLTTPTPDGPVEPAIEALRRFLRRHRQFFSKASVVGTAAGAGYAIDDVRNRIPHCRDLNRQANADPSLGLGYQALRECFIPFLLDAAAVFACLAAGAAAGGAIGAAACIAGAVLIAVLLASSDGHQAGPSDASPQAAALSPPLPGVERPVPSIQSSLRGAP